MAYVGQVTGANQWIAPDLQTYPASYIIHEDNSTYYAQGFGGLPNQSGTDAATVIQNALNNLTAARTWTERVILKGNFTVNTTLLVPSYTDIEIQGRVSTTTQTFTFFKNSDQTNGNSHISIHGGHIDGNGTGHYAIDFNKVDYFSICDLHFFDSTPTGTFILLR